MFMFLLWVFYLFSSYDVSFVMCGSFGDVPIWFYRRYRKVFEVMVFLFSVLSFLFYSAMSQGRGESGVGNMVT